MFVDPFKDVVATGQLKMRNLLKIESFHNS